MESSGNFHELETWGGERGKGEEAVQAEVGGLGRPKKGLVLCEVGTEDEGRKDPRNWGWGGLGHRAGSSGLYSEVTYTHPKHGCERPCPQGPGR